MDQKDRGDFGRISGPNAAMSMEEFTFATTPTLDWSFISPKMHDNVRLTE